MRDGRFAARQLRRRKRNLARAENIAIVALALLALLLAGKTGMLQQTLPVLGGAQTMEGGYTVGPAISLAGEAPVRLMLRDREERCGVEYDQTTVDDLYDGGLSDFLDGSLRAMEPPAGIREDAWQETITGADQWVFYDFLYDITFDQQESQGAGTGRLFLVTVKGGQADTISFYNETDRSYYSAKVREEVDLPALSPEPNGARFAFEDQSVSQILSPYMMILRQAPACTMYTASDPLLSMDAQGWNDLLESLDFNAKAVSPYTTATGSVIREGADTLRLMNDGAIQFHGSESGENRYVALSSRQKDLQLKAQEILDRATGDLRGPARLCCRSVRTLEDGQTELIFTYVLNGARVQMWGEGWGARFLFRDNVVTAYTILMRGYSDSGLLCPLLPARQAAAAASAMGRRGAELQVTYQDDGGQQSLASWTVREPR